ncbi:MAG: phage holin family protein [Patescibacteria group bacterium]|nr:MAG: phage holin family protein [Patescibacteria group bacterium]
MQLFLRWVLNAAALLLVAYLVPGVHVAGFYTALMAALILGIVNALIRPLLILLTLPITIVTLGLFTFVINALLLWFVSTVVKGFAIDGFVPALLGALVLWAMSVITNSLLQND